MQRRLRIGPTFRAGLGLLLAWAWAPQAQADCRYWIDGDGDGRGVFGGEYLDLPGGCTELEGWSASPGDCDDSDPTIYTSAPELCDGLDNDCDGTVDDGLPRSWYYVDADRDGYGGRVGATARYQCPRPEGYALGNTDCHDANPAIHPGAPEVCNGRDDDCDLSVDEGAAAVAWYADADGDGAGDPDTLHLGCPAPAGFVARGDDCDDEDPSVYPGAPEACGEGDRDCDGSETLPTAWYLDQDGDHYGGTEVLRSCEDGTPFGWVAVGGDCDDEDPSFFPGVLDQYCDGLDQDCDGVADQGAAEHLWYDDRDGDGWGDGLPLSSCEDLSPLGLSLLSGDCDDDWAGINPGAAEPYCTGVDLNCNGVPDEGAVERDWFEDRDRDGVGGAWQATDCADLSFTGAVLISGDCDDEDEDVVPGAPELYCDEVDNDCDGEVDEDSQAWAWYPDRDGDGYGDDTELPIASCRDEAGGGWTTRGGDCEDLLPQIHPGLVDPCNGGDDDCDGEVDEDQPPTMAFADNDDDGAPGEALGASCSPPPGSLAGGEPDCDDDDPDRHPGASEACNRIDDDCNDQIDDLWALAYPDLDLDGFGDEEGEPVEVPACEGDLPPGLSWPGDCDDLDPDTSPESPERCDGVDNDCDGTPDNGLTRLYPDRDGDGFGAEAEAPLDWPACAGAPLGWGPPGDCDDTQPSVYPGAPDPCDLVDQDCDGVAEAGLRFAYRDVDGDGWGDETAAWIALICDEGPPLGYGPAGDCAPEDPSIHPGAAEVCDGVDNTCDGAVDDALRPAYFDRDSDGFGGELAEEAAYPCDGVPDPGLSLTNDDCDDLDPTVWPGAPEPCDGRDHDCDGAPSADLIAAYPDEDGDGYPGSSELTDVVVCGEDLAGRGLTTRAEPLDCDDAREDIYPGAPEGEHCTEEDLNCDGRPAYERETITADRDGDGWGHMGIFFRESKLTCEPMPPGMGYPFDCLEENAMVAPYLPEICNGIDDDCDGEIDEGWPDGDEDGLCDEADPCPEHPANDEDGDGVCEPHDLCLGDDATGDTDGDGICDDRDFRVFLAEEWVASPGYPSLLVVTDAAPNARLVWFASLTQGEGPCLPRSSTCLDLVDPVGVGSSRSESDGRSRLKLTLPSSLPVGTVVNFQVVAFNPDGRVQDLSLVGWVTLEP